MPTFADQTSNRPALLITIDTEADNLWSRPRTFTTHNSRFLPRFQTLCERHGFKPTYLTDWQMVNCPFFREFAKDALRRGQAEIGMHLHAWNSPPLVPLTGDDLSYQPFLIEHPPEVIREKVKVVTAQLEETFGVKMLSHRSGRWSFNDDYARILVDYGYGVDCSVTPHVSWRSEGGGLARAAGSDFSRFPETAYYIDLSDISRSIEPVDRQPTLLEVPMTIMRVPTSATARIARGVLSFGGRFGHRISRGFFPAIRWLRPNGRNGRVLPRMLDELRESGRDYAEFMLHSSEFMPGGSPTFRFAHSIELLYNDLERFFSHAAKTFVGMTLADYATHCRARQSGIPRTPEVAVGSKHAG